MKEMHDGFDGDRVPGNDCRIEKQLIKKWYISNNESIRKRVLLIYMPRLWWVLGTNKLKKLYAI